MTKANPLFIMGNKRSGTSLLVRLLNLPPEVFVTHESDAVWILHQARDAQPAQYACYPWDGLLGMEATLQACRHILESLPAGRLVSDTAAETFFSIQEHLMNHGSAVQQPHRKTNLAWIGDKKPVQHSDPEIRASMRAWFPHARYIHLVRDPRAVVASAVEAARTWNRGVPQYWRQLPEDVLERWVIHEEWVLQAKSLETSPIHTLRLEDLCEEPVKKMAELFDFLELETPPGIAESICQLTNPTPNRKYESFNLPISPRAARIMQCYGYHRDRPTTALLGQDDTVNMPQQPPAEPVLGWLGKFDKIIVTGPQRSGTRICAKMIAHDTGHRYVDESEVGIDSLYRLRTLLQSNHRFVVQCPALCRHVHVFSDDDTAIVLMRRDVEDIIASQKRIGWSWEKVELARYDRSDGAIAEVKYRFWEEGQRRQIRHAFEIEYESLARHPLWVPKLLRRSFRAGQTTFRDEDKVDLASCHLDYLQSQSLELNVTDIRSVCLVLGPYRSLTTATASILFLHPSCQVLNHAAIRVLPIEDVNFLLDYSESKFESFVRYAVHISQEGRAGAHGGTIASSHVFAQETMRRTYEDRYGKSLIKGDIWCLLWKDSMRVANFIRENNVDLADILAQNEKLRFLMPIRNPLDCAVSNYRNGQARHFLDLENYRLENILDCILREILWFLDLQKDHPERFFYFFENDFDESLLSSLADFLCLEPVSDWIEDALKCYKLRDPCIHSHEFIDHYEQSLEVHLHRHPLIVEKLKTFSAQAREVNRNARPHPQPEISFQEEPEQDGAILVKMPGNTRLGVNATGRLIWTLCDGTRTRQDILQALQAHFDNVEEDVLARDLDRFINELIAQEFLQISPEPGVARSSHEAVET